MTIGIAAAGPRAGQAVLEGLRVAEAVGRGALHGFVSLVVIGRDGTLYRAETQDGGSRELFAGGPVPPAMAEAERAGLMSSGPNRPEPLGQFTPADPEVGLVTGHRFPNTPGVDGVPLNVAVLDLMRQGLRPDEAIGRITAMDPGADAGYLALSVAGEIHAGDTAYLAEFEDAGRVVGRSVDGRSRAGVIHNAIVPHASLSALVLETVFEAMSGQDRIDTWLTLTAGVPLQVGLRNTLTIDEAGRVREITVRDPRHLEGNRNFGLGYRAAVLREGLVVGHALDEPFLRAVDGRIASINGHADGKIALTRAAPSARMSDEPAG